MITCYPALRRLLTKAVVSRTHSTFTVVDRLHNISWNLRRYVFRRDFPRKVNARLTGYRRRAEKTEFGDLAHVYAGLDGPTVIFDVGANIGLVTSTLRRLFPLAEVHAFEPTEGTIRTLAQRLSGDRKVVINQVAVSDAIGTATFHVDNKTHGGGSNSLLGHTANFAVRSPVHRYQEVAVPTVTLEAYAADHSIEHIDILKLDIEGAELKALEGARSLLREHEIDFIATEMRFIEDYAGQPLFKDLVVHLEPLGYTIFNVYHSAESEIRQALFGNAVFVSDTMRRRLLEHYGPRACGWAEGSGASTATPGGGGGRPTPAE